jgi:P pilus assembly chaperone PapD
MTGNTTHQSIRDSIPPSKGQVLKNPALLQGIWAAEGEANATFVINGSKIIYPDSQRSYPFTPSKDTLAIL